MEIVQSESYEEFGAEFQYEMIGILNDTLKKYEISPELRKEICGDFTFNFSMLLDRGRINDTTPSLVFISDKKLLIRNEEFEFHEYAFGNVDQLFDSDLTTDNR
jgi:hypothetical protein